MKKVLVILFICLATFSMYGQKSAIKGTVIDENQQPVQFVSVELLKSKDSTKVVTATLTDLKGDFILENIKPDKYHIVISSIGFKTKKIKIEYPLADSISTIYTLAATADSLKEVVVTGKRIQRYADKNVYFIPAQVKKNLLLHLKF